MELSVTMAVDATEVEPGQRALDSKDRVVLVDEVSRSSKGVVILGWPLPRTEGNRVTIKPERDEPVRLVPSPEDESDLRIALRNALIGRFDEDPVGTFDIGGWHIELSEGWFDQDDPSLDGSEADNA